MKDDKTYISPMRWALKHKISKQTVYSWIKRGLFKKGDVKTIKRSLTRIMIREDAEKIPQR